MTTNELKQYIDKVLGNSIRCLLPSYWWKRLFGLVVDKVAEVDGKVNKLPTKSYIDDAIKDKVSEQYVDDAVKDKVSEQYVDDAVKGKQDTLVSGINIKTINGESVLGKGEIIIKTASYLTLIRPFDYTDEVLAANKVVYDKLVGDAGIFPGQLFSPVRILDGPTGEINVYPDNFFITYYEDVYAFGFIATIILDESDDEALCKEVKYLLTWRGDLIRTDIKQPADTIYIGNIDSSAETANKTLLNKGSLTAKTDIIYATKSKLVFCSMIAGAAGSVYIDGFYKNCYVITIYYNGNFEDWYILLNNGKVGRFPSIIDIRVLPGTIEFTSISETKQLNVTITPENAPENNIIWTSTDENVATVNDVGLVTAVGAGTCDIIATSEKYPSITSSCSVTVTIS